MSIATVTIPVELINDAGETIETEFRLCADIAPYRPAVYYGDYPQPAEGGIESVWAEYPSDSGKPTITEDHNELARLIESDFPGYIADLRTLEEESELNDRELYYSAFPDDYRY